MKRFVERSDDIQRLKTTLTNARIADKNNALYQTVFQLIDKLSEVNDDTNASIAAISSGGGGGGGGGGGTTIINNGGPVSRVVPLGQTVTIANTFCLIVVDYYQVDGTLTIQGDGVLKIIPA